MDAIFGIFNKINQDIPNSERKNVFINSFQGYGYKSSVGVTKKNLLLGGVSIQYNPAANIYKCENVIILFAGDFFNEDLEGRDIGQYLFSIYSSGKLDLIKNFNGAFIFAFFDMRSNKLTIACDRYGLKKIYYYNTDVEFSFSPRLTPLLKLNSKNRLQKESIKEFFLFWHILGNKTFFKNIYQLPPASILEVSQNKLNIQRYWTYKFKSNPYSTNENELADELAGLWQKAVERRIKKEEKLIIPLSGGLDSRATLAAALKYTSPGNIITFSFGEQNSMDLKIGKEVAQKAGVIHIPLFAEKTNFEEQYMISLQDTEGIVDITPYFSVKGYESMRKYGNKILSGFIGDFIMGSNMYPDMFDKFPKNTNDYELAARIFFEKILINNPKVVKSIFSESFISQIQNPISVNMLKKYINTNLADIYFNHFLDNHVKNYTYFTCFRYRNYFNYLSPFLDNDLIDFMRTIPIELRYKQRLFRLMLMRNYHELFKLPVKNNLGLRLDIHPYLINVKKKLIKSKWKINRLSTTLLHRNILFDSTINYVDYNNLLRTNKEYKKFICCKLEKAKKRNIFNDKSINIILKNHMMGLGSHIIIINQIVTLEFILEYLLH